MGKKLLFLIILACLITGCSSQETLEDSLIEYVHSEKEIDKKDSILKYSMDDQVYFAIFPAYRNGTNEFFVVGGTKWKKKGFIPGDSLRGSASLLYFDMQNESVSIGNITKKSYISVALKDKEYSYGITYGFYNTVTYDGKVIDSQNAKLVYHGKEVKLTAWFLESEENNKFKEELLEFTN